MTQMALVGLEVAGAVATVTLDSPRNRNALSAQLRDDLAQCLERARGDDGVRVVVLTHTGPVFCSGMDLREERDAAPGREGVRDLPRLLHAIWTMPKPVVARLAGPARAGGMGLAAACDIAVCTQDATFAFTEVRLGLVAASISGVVLPRMDSRAAHELFLTGATFSAHRAVEIGLVNACPPAERLDAVVQTYVDDLLLAEPGAAAATKALVQARQAPNLAEELDALADASARQFASEQAREGMRAFAEKRPPRWVSGTR
jgi:methylglutaconyl-CoA hydratase